MTNPPVELPGRGRWIPRAIALLSLGLIVMAASDYLRGMPDSYHNEKSRSLFLALALFTQSITDEVRVTWARWSLLAVTMVLVAVAIWLSR